MKSNKEYYLPSYILCMLVLHGEQLQHTNCQVDLLKVHSQQITSVYKTMEDHMRQEREFRSDGFMGRGGKYYWQYWSKRMTICKCVLKTVSLEANNKMSTTDWKDGDKEMSLYLYLYHVENLAPTHKLPCLPNIAQGKWVWRKSHWAYNKDTLGDFKNFFFQKVMGTAISRKRIWIFGDGKRYYGYGVWRLRQGMEKNEKVASGRCNVISNFLKAHEQFTVMQEQYTRSMSVCQRWNWWL